MPLSSPGAEINRIAWPSPPTAAFESVQLLSPAEMNGFPGTTRLTTPGTSRRSFLACSAARMEGALHPPQQKKNAASRGQKARAAENRRPPPPGHPGQAGSQKPGGKNVQD